MKEKILQELDEKMFHEFDANNADIVKDYGFNTNGIRTIVTEDCIKTLEVFTEYKSLIDQGILVVASNQEAIKCDKCGIIYDLYDTELEDGEIICKDCTSRFEDAEKKIESVKHLTEFLTNILSSDEIELDFNWEQASNLSIESITITFKKGEEELEPIVFENDFDSLIESVIENVKSILDRSFFNSNEELGEYYLLQETDAWRTYSSAETVGLYSSIELALLETILLTEKPIEGNNDQYETVGEDDKRYFNILRLELNMKI